MTEKEFETFCRQRLRKPNFVLGEEEELDDEDEEKT